MNFDYLFSTLLGLDLASIAVCDSVTSTNRSIDLGTMYQTFSNRRLKRFCKQKQSKM